MNPKISNLPERNFPLPPHLAVCVKERDFLLKQLRDSADFRKTSKLWRFGELLLLALCGAGFSFAFPAWNYGSLGWIGIVPLLIFCIGVTPARGAINGFVWGFAFAAVSFNWFREIGAAFPYIAAFVLALFPMVWGGLIPFLYRNIVVPVTARREGYEAEQLALLRPSPWHETLFCIVAAALWVSLEWIRSWVGTGLPWNTLATTQWQNPSLLQVCEWSSFYGISFLVAMGNVAVYLALRGFYRMLQRGQYARMWPTLITVCLIVAVMISVSRKGQDAARPNPAIPRDPSDQIIRVGAIQTNTPVSWGKPVGDKSAILNRLINLSLMLAKNDKPDFILWPETAVPLVYRRSQEYQDAIRDLSKMIKIPILIGSADLSADGCNYNSAFLIDASGKLSDRYDKVHIVPFGEFIPFGSMLDTLFPDLRRRFMLPNDLTPGQQFNPVEIIPGVRLGISICFEDVFPYVSRREVLAGANLLATITNDAWYPASDEREQHLANAVFRAVETRTFVVRTGNMAPACLIDPAGNIVRWHKYFPGEPFDGMAVAEGYTTFEIALPRKSEKTFYTRYGDLFAIGCTVFSLLALLGAAWRWREFKIFLAQQRQTLAPNHEPT